RAPGSAPRRPPGSRGQRRRARPRARPRPPSPPARRRATPAACPRPTRSWPWLDGSSGRSLRASLQRRQVRGPALEPPPPGPPDPLLGGVGVSGDDATFRAGILLRGRTKSNVLRHGEMIVVALTACGFLLLGVGLIGAGLARDARADAPLVALPAAPLPVPAA